MFKNLYFYINLCLVQTYFDLDEANFLYSDKPSIKISKYTLLINLTIYLEKQSSIA
jgi:hypothetical protein